MANTTKPKPRKNRLDALKELVKDEEFQELLFKALRIILELLTE